VRPLVSICIPTYNAAGTIERCIRSALAQDYTAIEVIVVDDGSRDGTPALVRRFGDQRLRMVVRTRNIGPNKTWNESVTRARGKFIKFLHQDDELLPDCVSGMSQVLIRNDSIGMVFCRRQVVVSGDSATHRAWAANFEDVHEPLMPLGERNSGRALLVRWWNDSQMRRNVVGEPVAVMVTREALDQVGLFHPLMRQLIDAELWVRVMNSFDAGFIDERLVRYATGPESLTTRNERDASYWVDRLWMLETLSGCARGGTPLPGIEPLLRRERAIVIRTLASLVARRTDGRPVQPALRYLAWLAARYAPISRHRPISTVL
jgi:glycosyltransferase involved in cell wall biosynthesis